MTTVTNNGKRRLGIAGRPSIILDPGQTSEPLSAERYQSILSNRVNARWIEAGILLVKGADAPAPKASKEEAPKETGKGKKEKLVALPDDFPEDLTGEGVELHHTGGGWYDVYVNTFKVTSDQKVKKARALEIAAEYK